MADVHSIAFVDKTSYSATPQVEQVFTHQPMWVEVRMLLVGWNVVGLAASHARQVGWRAINRLQRRMGFGYAGQPQLVSAFTLTYLHRILIVQLLPDDTCSAGERDCCSATFEEYSAKPPNCFWGPTWLPGWPLKYRYLGFPPKIIASDLEFESQLPVGKG